MTQGFLEQESINANKRKRKLFLSLFLFFICMIGFLYFATRDSIDLNNPRDHQLVVLFCIIIGLMLFCTTAGLLLSILPAKNGKNLLLPFEENTKEAVAALIDQEVAEGKIVYEGYMNHNTIKPYPERIILLPTHLLLIGEMGRVTAIPRDKILWLCAQTGYKGGPFYVRILVFTEKNIFDFGGNDIEHTKEIANDLYQYIPNVFHKYDPQELSYSLEKLFRENHDGFMEYYKEAKENMQNTTNRNPIEK